LGPDLDKISICGVKTVSECHHINCGVFKLLKKVICHCSEAFVSGAFVRGSVHFWLAGGAGPESGERKAKVKLIFLVNKHYFNRYYAGI
jgi:hypothetical protein